MGQENNMNESIPFNRIFLTGDEVNNVNLAFKKSQAGGKLSGDGSFTEKVSEFLETKFGAQKVLLTHSCTAALEMAAILADIQPGDEVIMPSYTFVSTANAFVLRGGVPVFVDINPKTLNIDETLIEEAITIKTKVIVPVHYAGVACEMDTILDIAKRHNLLVIEDAAQGVFSTYKGRPLGTIGDLGCYSFHDTKNIICGEGGALLINCKDLSDRAEIIREKGTNRSAFISGRVDKYTWQDIGSSYLPPETSAAMLLAQLENGFAISDRRRRIWKLYDDQLQGHNAFTTPHYGADVVHNGHMYFVLLKDSHQREECISYLKGLGVQAVSHYVPLHSSPAGMKYCRTYGSMEHTDKCAAQIMRLPFYCGVEEHIDYIGKAVQEYFSKLFEESD